MDKPICRRLRGYAFDPSLSLSLDTVGINQVTYEVAWEEGKDSKGVPIFGLGPFGEYLEVIDVDPASSTRYIPVDLNHSYLLAEDGLEPSESNPQFHQQMVYAVAMVTIANFEQALGRKIFWSSRLVEGKEYETYVRRLRIYPHALREANAYYSPAKKAVLFGYFSAFPSRNLAIMPGSHVFTCLSHDIIAHEVTHALLDGLHRNYNQPSNPDVLAFHEAFADIVALFQHFTFPEVLRHQIARTKGDLGKQNLLGELAQQVGAAIGHSGSLREAIGKRNEETGKWEPCEPDHRAYAREFEPHKRGSILVAAVFEAFLTIYKDRVKDLLRIATGGSGILPEGELQPDLVERLAEEASKSSRHVLSMCVRALDYCPPVDITFGDFLRAIVTADYELVARDPHHYRLAFINAFRRRGIYPKGIKTLSEDSLRYPLAAKGLSRSSSSMLLALGDIFEDYWKEVIDLSDRETIWRTSRDFIRGGKAGRKDEQRMGLHQRLKETVGYSVDFERLTGMILKDWKEFGVRTSKGGPSFEIINLRLVARVGPDGNKMNQIVFGLRQKMTGTWDGEKFVANVSRSKKGSIQVQGGCTIIYDLDERALKYAISKPLLDPEQLRQKHPKRRVNHLRLELQKGFEQEILPLHSPELSQYFGMPLANSQFGEPFSFLHQT